jgi:3',5'-nucleoside bisphosphate phosphatase
MSSETRARPRAVRADLHSHSRHSDGTLTPRGLIERAAARGVELFALTDHDELLGLDEAACAAVELGVQLVPGVEVSVTWAARTIHVVGLGVDRDHPELKAGLARVRAGRHERAREMSDELARVGIDGALEGALAHVTNPDMISRTHFARHLVASGVCRDMRDVFSRYLTEGKPGYVPHRWATLADAIQWINAAGGVAVLAHPGRYSIGELALIELLTQFRATGGTAIEVSTSSHTSAERRHFGALAQQFGLEASGGSDFHGPGESPGVELGLVAELPAGLTPVWHRFV